MRISDWSSDVCSSDLSDTGFSALQDSGAFALSWAAYGLRYGIRTEIDAELVAGRQVVVDVSRAVLADARRRYPGLLVVVIDRKSVVEGTSVSVSLVLGGRRAINKHNNNIHI